MSINFYNCDCMDFMAGCADNAYDLAIVDPPYGIHDKLLTSDKKQNKSNKFALKYQEKNWDKLRPTIKYFNELKRISKNQIICGANYFVEFLPVSRGWVFWDKMGEKMTVVNNELIYTSFDICIKTFKRCHGMDKGFLSDHKVFHPTTKPTALYRWLLKNYAKPNDKILDTHGGSMSIAIACHDMGFDLDLCELDKDYFEAGKKRFENHISQGRFF